MSNSCNRDCSNCSEACAERDPNSFLAKTKETNHIKKVIGIASGKGGVGKSMVTSLLAIALRKKGYNVAILDADITGPSIPKTFGIKEKALGDGIGILPATSKSGIKLMSLNLLVENESDPVAWRGPIIGNIIRQFWSDVYWNDVDFMLVDLPPGTADAVLTVYQSIPLSGVVVVSTPQELVGMIVEKSIKMAEMVNLPVLGLVENMSYVLCPHCGEKISVFGESRLEEIADSYGIPYIAQLPIDPTLAKAVDSGTLEEKEVTDLDNIITALEECEARVY